MRSCSSASKRYSEYILDKLLATVDQAVRGKLDFKEHAVLFEQHFSVRSMLPKLALTPS